MMDPTDGRRGFPRWLEPLRPDETTRARLRRAIQREAEPVLAARRRGSWWDVASGWATLLAPAAAGLAILFAAIAYRAGLVESSPQAVARAAATEPVAASAGEIVPAVLTADSASGAELVLTATVYPEE